MSNINPDMLMVLTTMPHENPELEPSGRLVPLDLPSPT